MFRTPHAAAEKAAAVGLGALIGPAQVGARLVEMATGGRLHPIWTLAATALLIAAGFGTLWLGYFMPALVLIAAARATVCGRQPAAHRRW